VQQVTWTSPMTSRLLLEAGFGTYLSRWGGAEMPGNPSRDIVRVVEQCARGCADNGNIANLTYRSQNWLSTTRDRSRGADPRPMSRAPRA
jgi:hypothetical protein